MTQDEYYTYLENASDKLEHFGVKNQKWGRRQWQNEDGSLTPAGYIHYGYGKNDTEHHLDNKSNHRLTKESAEKIRKKKGIRKYQNEDGSLTDEGKKKYDENDKAGKYDKYKKLGLNEKDSFTAQYNSDKLKKGLAIAGGVALTAAAVYAGRQYLLNNRDTIIKSGMKLQTILGSETIDTGKQFYTSFHGLDKLRYGAIGLQQKLNDGVSYKHTLKATKDIKIASNKSASKVFNSLIDTDSEFAENVRQLIRDRNSPYEFDPFHYKVADKSFKELTNGKLGKNSYELFNVNLASGGMSETTRNKFYEALKKAGYDGIKDVNDVKYTNYRSITPAIIFNGEQSVKHIKTSELSNAHFAAGVATVMGQGYAKLLKVPVAAIAGVKVYNKANEPKMVAQYKKEHPNTEKTYEQILEMLKD